MAHNSNWIKLYRQIFDSQIWNVKEPFDIRSAWIDLILLANHKDGKVIISGELIKVPRGAHFTSVQHLAARWKWSIKRVRGYLKLLEKAEMVTVVGTHRGTLVTIVNYDDYQGRGQTEGTPHGTSEGTPEGISEGTSEGTQTRNKEIKNDKEGKEALSSSVDCPWWHDDYEDGKDDDDDYWNEVNDDDERRSEECIPDDRRELDVPTRTFNYADKVRKLIYGIERLSDPRGGTGDSECDS